MFKSKRVLGLVLSCLILMSIAFSSPISVSAAAKPKLNKKSVSITRTKSYKLKLKNAKASKVKWSSSNKKIAVVSKGKVTAKKVGKATVTAKYKGKSYKCKVTVKAKVVKKGTFSVYKNESITLQLKSSLGTVLKVKSWKSSNKAVASVTSKGVVKGKKVGSTTITATNTLGDQYKATVKVKDPYLALKKYIKKNGELGSEGEYSIHSSYNYGGTNYDAYINYYPSEDSFEFYTENASDSFNFLLSMVIPYGGTSEAPTAYICVGEEDLYFGAVAEVNPSSYTVDTNIDFMLILGDVEDNKLQEYANYDLDASMLCWEDMIYESIGASMKAFGFKKF